MSFVSPCPITGCWWWTGALDTKGYGRILVGRSSQRAHRVGYELLVGPVPDLAGYHGGCLLYRCDQPSCVNPAHLRPGSHAENMADMASKGRAVAPGQRFALALMLFALSCKGWGCTAGDVLNTCRDSCGAAGVSVALPTQNVCVCREARP